jgi:hypothetical protein
MKTQRGNDFQKAEYIAKTEVTELFHTDMNSLATSWLGGNMSFSQYNDQRSEYLTRYFSEKDTIYKMKLLLDEKSVDDINRYYAGKENILDTKMNEYREIMGNPVKDTSGMPDWETTIRNADEYLEKQDAETREYIDTHYHDWIKELPVEAQNVELLREGMKELLVPYWNVRDTILNKNLKLKSLYESYKKIERTDPQKAQIMLRINPVLANALSSLEKQVSMIRDNMRRSNKDLDKAVRIWYA